MRRVAARSIAACAGVVGAGVLAGPFLGGGTVRSPVSGAQEAAVISTQPGKQEPPPGVSFAAVGDTMLGNTPDLPADPGSYLSR
jgi:hypothetical protein